MAFCTLSSLLSFDVHCWLLPVQGPQGLADMRHVWCRTVGRVKHADTRPGHSAFPLLGMAITGSIILPMAPCRGPHRSRYRGAIVSLVTMSTRFPGMCLRSSSPWFSRPAPM